MAPKRKKIVESEDEEVAEEEVKPRERKRAATKDKSYIKEKNTEPFEDELGWNVVPPSLLYKDWDTEPSSRIAAFDLDGTLVNVKSGMVFPRNASDWKWFNKKVEKKLKEYAENGYKIVVFSNQGGIKSSLTGVMATKVKERINQIAEKISVPMQVFCATLEDAYRKPGVGMWEFFLKNCNGGIPAGKGSFFVGDAAGRPGDFADTDRAFAKAAGLDFKLPEDVFGEMEGKKALPPVGAAPPEGASQNPELVDIFTRLAELNAQTDKRFQAAAFQKVAGALRAYPAKVTEASLKDVAKLPGVGKGSITVMKEYLSTGRVAALDGPAEEDAVANPAVKARTQKAKEQADAERSMALAFM